ncbi:MAG: hypothetical protein KDD38_09785, partial [Bdellovibrionales bacterium]|nr:hypothetical protein [Bdellovibrionales bacterium]
YKFKKITARVTDLTIVDKSGREAKLTLTDVKRGRLHINNKLVSYDQKKSISENLTQFTKIAAPHQVAANFLLRPTLTTPILVIFGFVPQLTTRAEAYGVLGVAAAIGVVGLAAGLYFDFFASSEAQASEIQDLIQSAGYKPNVKIECSAFFNSDSQLPDSVSLDLTKNDNSKVNYLISTKTSDFRVTPAEWADKDGFSFDDRQTLIDKTKSCCKTAGCMNLANSTTGFSSPHGTSGTNNKKPASHGAGSIK